MENGIAMICWNCGNSDNIPQKPGRRDLCPSCNAYLHCCRNCAFYDRNAHHECREPQAEWVKEKDKGNYCDYFRPGSGGTVKGANKKTSGDDAKAKWDSLFGK